MYNDLLTIGSFTIHGYGLMIAIGVFVALIIGDYRAKKKNLDSDFLWSLTFICVVFGFLGAKLLFVLVELPAMLEDPMLILSGNGFVVYGGIIGGVTAALVACKRKNMDFFQYFDLVMPSVAIAQGFGRIGCFLAGCCYGAPTDSPIGIAFVHSDIAPNGIKLIPTQLISSVGMFCIAIILILFSKKAKVKGQVGALYLILYSIGRFVIEFFRNDYRGAIGVLSTSQFISLFAVATGIILMFMFTKKAKEQE